MKFFNIFPFLWVIFVLLDPDPDQQHWSKGWISDKKNYYSSENHSVLRYNFSLVRTLDLCPVLIQIQTLESRLLNFVNPWRHHWEMFIEIRIPCFKVKRRIRIHYEFGQTRIWNTAKKFRVHNQCCGSKFFQPGSRVKKIPDLKYGSESKSLSILSPKNCF